MSKVEIVLNSSGIREFLCGPEVESLITEHASATAAACGLGYEYRIHRSEQRVIANVYAADSAAVKDNLENNTILKALR